MSAHSSFMAAVAAATVIAVSGTAMGLTTQPAAPKAGEKKPDFPPFDKTIEGLTKVVSTADGAAALYDLYADKETGRLMAVLPANYGKQLLMVACTVSGGDPHSGVMGPTHYVQWRKINKQLALIAPDLSVRTSGDQQAKDSIEQLFTGRVILSVPIASMAPGNRPVIDLGAIATKQTSKFFGPAVYSGYGPSLSSVNAQLATLTKAKAFPKNVIVQYEAPRHDGRMALITYSIGELAGTPGYKPRKADPRVGYFYDYHQDFAKLSTEDITDRYISRWNVEKADDRLKMSPPKEPIVWYIENTTPVQFRRYVREGIQMWNKAFEEVGILGALEVYQQDASTGAHMDKDPEDARYNFFRWNASDQGYAIGPSRTNPKTGEILDADVVWHQGLTRSVRRMLESLSENLVDQAFSPETIAFFGDYPNWDPRVRMAPAARQEQLKLQLALDLQVAAEEPLSSEKHPWTLGLNDPTDTACRIGNMLSLDLSLMDAALTAGLIDNPSGETLDGLPEEFLGQMIRYISAHEVGHCLGLQHNMAASSIRTLEEINTEGYEGATVASVMDYAAANINHNNTLGEVQGPYATPVAGPYDKWAIAYGYGPEDKLEEVLKGVSDPDHIYVSQMAMMTGSDPRNMTWDMGANNLEFCESRLGIVKELRSKLVSDVITDGESWSKARQRYQALLGTHFQTLMVAMPWIGGSYTNNDFKGDPGGRAPVEDVPAAAQRRALNFICDNTFEDGAFGLTPDLVRHMGKEYWWDPDGIDELLEDPSMDVHDMVGGVQAVALTIVMNPTTLRRVYDNEYRTTGSADSFTLAEVVDTVTDSIWTECATAKPNGWSAAAPMISSFRRNLQREHVQRLTDLALMPDRASPALRTISALATQELRQIDKLAGKAQGVDPDPYTEAHLADVRTRIAKTLEAAYVLTP